MTWEKINVDRLFCSFSSKLSLYYYACSQNTIHHLRAALHCSLQLQESDSQAFRNLQLKCYRVIKTDAVCCLVFVDSQQSNLINKPERLDSEFRNKSCSIYFLSRLADISKRNARKHKIQSDKAQHPMTAWVPGDWGTLSWQTQLSVWMMAWSELIILDNVWSKQKELITQNSNGGKVVTRKKGGRWWMSGRQNGRKACNEEWWRDGETGAASLKNDHRMIQKGRVRERESKFYKQTFEIICDVDQK